VTASIAETHAPDLHPLLAGRWSTRAFDPAHELTEAELRALLEAARWAPIANNSQPWRFGLARRGEPTFDAVLNALAPGNQQWAHRASALLVLAADTGEGERPWAAYDAGQAAALLTVQAEHLDLSVHQMGGFDPALVAAAFSVPEGVRPMTVLAIGRFAPQVELPEPFAARETAPRARRPIDELMLAPVAEAEDGVAA
jgi:nitroreductase